MNHLTPVNRFTDCTTIQDLQVKIERSPKMLVNRDIVNEICDVIPAIVAVSPSETLDVSFIVRVLQNMHALPFDAYILGPVDLSMTDPQQRFMSYPHRIISIYVHQMFTRFGPSCYPITLINQTSGYHIDPDGGSNDLIYYHEAMGLIFLMMQLDNPSHSSMLMWEAITQDHSIVSGALRVLINCSNMAVEYTNVVADACAAFIVDNHVGAPEDGSMRVLRCGVGESLAALLEPYVEKFEVPHHELMKDCMDLFGILHTLTITDSARLVAIYKYIRMFAVEIPLSNKTQELHSKYSTMFGDDVSIITIDLYSAIMKHVDILTKPKMVDYSSMVLRQDIQVSFNAWVASVVGQFPNLDYDMFLSYIRDVVQLYGSEASRATHKNIVDNVISLVDSVYGKIVSSPSEGMESDFDIDSISFAGFEADFEALEMMSSLLDVAMEADDPTGATPTGSPNIRKAKTGGDAGQKIYKGFKKYKENEKVVDDTLVKGIAMLKKAIVGDQNAILIEGKKFSPIGFLKKILTTVAIFHTSKILLIIGIVTKFALKGKTKRAERRKILLALNEELALVNEKLDDARGDGNREAKYELMRTKAALENAIERLKRGLEAEADPKALMKTNPAGYNG